MSLKPLLTFTLIFSLTVSQECPLFELSETILKLYKDPANGLEEELINASKDYLCELVKLQMGTRINKTGSLETLRELYLEGNPPYHTRNIPWDKFIEVYGWADVDINGYQQTIADTRRIWDVCLEALDNNKESDEII